MKLTPGAKLFVQGAPYLLGPPLCLLAAHTVAQLYLQRDIHVPLALYLVTFVFALPISITISVQKETILNAYARYRTDTIAPPLIKSKLPGGFDLIPQFVKDYKTNYLGETLRRLSDEYGTCFDARTAFESRIFTTEPDHLKAILATEFDSFGKGDRFKFQCNSVLGVGVFNSDGEMWKFHRSMTRPFFNRDRIVHFELFHRLSDNVIRLMKERLAQDPTQAIDLQDAMSRFTLDSASEFLFGNSVDSLSAGLPYSPHLKINQGKKHIEEVNSHPANIFANAFADVQTAIAERSRYGGVWPLMEISKARTDDDMRTIAKLIDPVIEAAIERKRASAKNRDQSTTEKSEEADSDDITLLDHLINLTEDPTIIKDETLNIMIAGRDTTASTLTFLGYALALHPHVLTRLRAEILTVVGPTRPPTYDDLREMKYLRAVINETLRLFAPVPFNIREANTPVIFSNKNGKPFYVPAGTRVPYSVFLMHRRTDLWGPDALEFDPDRFLDERLHKYLVPNPFIFLPFNAGPRICLGQQFAYNEVSFMIIRLLQTFNTIELAEDAQPPESKPPKEWAETGTGRKKIEKIWPRAHLTLYSVGGLWVRMKCDEKV